MNKEQYLKIIANNLAILVREVELRNSISLFDINIIAEDFYKDFLKLIYGYNLTNLNIIEKNTSAIDLVDKEKKIAIQVTSDNSSTKITETIDKFIEKKLYNQYEKLQFLILTNKKKYTKTFITKSLFSFEKDTDIFDHTDLMQHIKAKGTPELKEIVDFLDQELSYKVLEKKKKQANEVETIIALIEYLTSNKAISDKKMKPSFTDPEHKINKRFQKYSEALKSLYIDLLTLYDFALKQAYETLGLDDAKSFAISLYLKDISDTHLEECKGNPRQALEQLTTHFEQQISESGFEFDKMAIKYFLISETIKCNVFPNGR